MGHLNLNILVVDDDEFFANVVAGQLREEFHHRTTVAENGLQARKIVETNGTHFDMILSDYDMPEMNGLDFLRWLKGSGIDSPVVMLTAAGSESVAVEAMKLGAYDYLRKDQLDLAHLDVVVDATYERRQFRISQELEKEQLREIALNKTATDKARDVLNAITPPLNNALAEIHSDIELEGEKIIASIPPNEREPLRKLLARIQHEVATLETGIKGLLGLYRLLHAHHAATREIEELRKELEEMNFAGRT